MPSIIEIRLSGTLHSEPDAGYPLTTIELRIGERRITNVMLPSEDASEVIDVACRALATALRKELAEHLTRHATSTGRLHPRTPRI